MINEKTHKKISIHFKDKERPPIEYYDAEIAIDPALNVYEVTAIIQLPIDDEDPDHPDKASQYGYFKVVERINMSEVLRMYILDESK